MLRFKEEKLSGLYSIYPTKHTDDRGYFFEAFREENYAAICSGLNFVQDNVSKSSKGTLRGLHFQVPPFAQAKLVQVLHGSVLDVVVDLRKSSPTYGHSYQQILSAENGIQLFIPSGFAHGFYTLEDQTIFSYKCTAIFEKTAERCLLWNDSHLNIDWQLDTAPLLSEKDRNGMPFNDFQTPF